MPTAPLPAGLNLSSLPFDGALAGSPVMAVVAAGDEQPGAPDGFPAILHDQISNANKELQGTDSKENIGVVDVIPMLPFGIGVVDPTAPGWKHSGESPGVVEGGALGNPLAQAGTGLPARAAGEGSGSVLPEGRQSGAVGVAPTGADWVGSQLAALSRERIADPAVTLPRGQVEAPGQPVPAGPAGSGVLPAGTVAPVTGSGTALVLDPLAASITQPPDAPLRGQPAATPPAADDAKPVLPALPEQAARALPAAAYLRQQQPLPPPDPLAGAADAALDTNPGKAAPAMPAPRSAVAQSLPVTQRPPAEPATVIPAVSIIPSSAAVHVGDKEVSGSSRSLHAAVSAPLSAPRAVPLPIGPAASLAASSTEPGREATPAGSWLAAQLGAVPQSAAPVSRNAPTQAGIAPGSAMAEATQPAAGAGASAPPLPVSGAASAEAVAALVSFESGLDRETVGAAALPDSASRSSSLPAAGPSMAALAQPRSESLPAPVFGQPLQLSSAGFADDLGQRILWLSGSNLRSAEIHIDPPELGPLQITVQAHREGTTVHFTTHNTQARDAVEATLPRLRELLEGNGAGTVDVNVAQQQSDARPGEREVPIMANAAPRAVRVEPGTLDPLPRLRQGLIDDYA